MNNREKIAISVTLTSIIGLIITSIIGATLSVTTPLLGLTLLILAIIGLCGETVLENSDNFNEWYKNNPVAVWSDLAFWKIVEWMEGDSVV